MNRNPGANRSDRRCEFGENGKGESNVYGIYG